MSEKVCYNCHQSGHLKMNCPMKSVCYKCGSEDHRMSECTSDSKSMDFVQCYKCEERGHFAKDCPQKDSRDYNRDRDYNRGYKRNDRGYSSDRCFTCKKSGHFKADCPMRDSKHNLCYKCGSDQHLMSDCPSDATTLEYAHCYACNEKGHFANDCPHNDEAMDPEDDGEYNEFQKSALRKRQEQGTLLLDRKTEDKIYRQKRGMRKAGMPEEDIRAHVNKTRRQEESKYKRVMEKKCFRCRKTGHLIDQCPLQEDKHDLCFRCGSSEHRLADCTSKNKTLEFAHCFICQEKGHMARDCPRNDKGVYPEGGSCKECGSIDHKLKDCTKAVKAEGS